MHYSTKSFYVEDRFQYKVLHVSVLRYVVSRCIRIARKGVLVNSVALEKIRVSPFPEMKGGTQGECPL